MKQAKKLLLLVVKTTGVSFLQPEEVFWLFDKAIRRIERQGAAAAKPSEADPDLVVTVAGSRSDEIDAGRSPPLSITDPLVPVLALFNDLMAANTPHSYRRSIPNGTSREHEHEARCPHRERGLR